MAMGYRDAWDYLDEPHPDGVPKDPTCTAMTEPPVGVRLSERLRGQVGGEDLTLRVTAELPSRSGRAAADRVVGHVDHAPVGRPGAAGRRPARADGSRPGLPGAGPRRGGWVDVEAVASSPTTTGLDAWADATTSSSAPARGDRPLRLGPLDAARASSSAEPVARTGRWTGPARWPASARTGLRRALATY
jgi:hypothetical protein